MNVSLYYSFNFANFPQQTVENQFASSSLVLLLSGKVSAYQLSHNLMKKSQCPSQDPKKVSWESSSKTRERKDCLECFSFFPLLTHFCSPTSMDIHQSCQWPPTKFSSHCCLNSQVWSRFSIDFVPGILSGSAGVEYLSSHFCLFSVTRIRDFYRKIEYEYIY